MNKAPEYHLAPEIVLDYCSDCLNRSDVIKYEMSQASKYIGLNRFDIFRFRTNYFFTPAEVSLSDSNLFVRRSIIPLFSEYICYYYTADFKKYPPIRYQYEGYSIIEFNCGTEPFGYDTIEANIEYYWEGRYPGLTPVRDVPLDSFKLGYYSIVKWLYAQETDRYKVKRKKHEHFDHDYMHSPSITLENLILEDPWQEEFLFTTYELIDTHPGPYNGYLILTVVPYTLAPFHLYEVRTSEYAPKRGKYHINVADMAIRVKRNPTYDEM